MAPTSLPGTTDRRLASLLTLFANNATIAISGARIAKEIGVSRSTVWRWVERLREVGVRVKGRPNNKQRAAAGRDAIGIRSALLASTRRYYCGRRFLPCKLPY